MTLSRRGGSMSSKTITITEAAYARLAAEKRPDESFTDVILRLTRPKAIPLSELHKHISRESAEALAEAIEASRNGRIARRERRVARER